MKDLWSIKRNQVQILTSNRKYKAPWNLNPVCIQGQSSMIFEDEKLDIKRQLFYCIWNFWHTNSFIFPNSAKKYLFNLWERKGFLKGGREKCYFEKINPWGQFINVYESMKTIWSILPVQTLVPLSVSKVDIQKPSVSDYIQEFQDPHGGSERLESVHFFSFLLFWKQ